MAKGCGHPTPPWLISIWSWPVTIATGSGQSSAKCGKWNRPDDNHFSPRLGMGRLVADTAAARKPRTGHRLNPPCLKHGPFPDRGVGPTFSDLTFLRRGTRRRRRLGPSAFRFRGESAGRHGRGFRIGLYLRSRRSRWLSSWPRSWWSRTRRSCSGPGGVRSRARQARMDILTEQSVSQKCRVCGSTGWPPACS